MKFKATTAAVLHTLGKFNGHVATHAGRDGKIFLSMSLIVVACAVWFDLTFIKNQTISDDNELFSPI
jgi:hypothetical protein